MVDQLKQFGETRRGWLGVHVQNVTDEIAKSLGLQEPVGALVAKVSPGSPAAAAGIQPSDVILKFDGQPIDNMRSLPRAVAATAIGKAVVRRAAAKGEVIHLTVTVGRLPEEPRGRGRRETDRRASQAPTPRSRREPDREELLGLSIAPLTDELRSHSASARASRAW